MERPFIFIEYKTTSRDEFEVTEGRQPTYALFYLKKGSFRLMLDGVEQTVKENDCVIFSDDIDFFRTVIEPISFIYLKFKINEKCPFKVEIPLGVVQFKNKKRFLESIKKYESLTEAQNPSAIYYREHILEDILLQAFDEYRGRSAFAIYNGSIEYEIKNCHDAIAKNVAQYIYENPSQKLTVEALCRIANTNPSTLNFKIRKAFSMSPIALTEHIRMNKARALLRNSTYTVGEIAERCGFENIYYFSSVFKKNHRLSPSEYRKQYR